MSRKYLAFDLEIAKEIPDEGDWRTHSPLGITCAAMLPMDTGQLVTWYGRTSTGQPSPRMNQEEAKVIVWALAAMVGTGGYTLVTWNGLNFDFPVMAEESELATECKELAAHHVDMMFHLFCGKGYRLSLDAAAKGMGLAGKTPGVTGADAPRYWAEGRYREILDYLAQDVQTTGHLAHSCDQQAALRWTSQRGNAMELALPNGLLTVEEAMLQQEPDTSWMSNPQSRSDFTGWLRQTN